MPPITADTRGPARSLFRHFKNRARGSSVLRIGGAYATYQGPDQATVDLATEVYLGGHVYDVSDEVALALVAAGYSVGLEGGYDALIGGYRGGY